MAEILTFTVPVTQASIRMDRVILDFNSQTVTILWLGINGEQGHADYTTPAKSKDAKTLLSGAALLTQINSGTFTASSLVKWCWNRLIADGYVTAGVVSGTPS